MCFSKTYNVQPFQKVVIITIIITTTYFLLLLWSCFLELPQGTFRSTIFYIYIT